MLIPFFRGGLTAKLIRLAAVVLVAALGQFSLLADEPNRSPGSPPESGASTEETTPFAYKKGPLTAKIGGIAEINVPKGMVYIAKDDIADFMRATQNFPSGQELGIIAAEEFEWFVIYSFDDVGYIKDDEKDSLDPVQLLAQIREGTDKANQRRRAQGWDTLSIVGWGEQPHYENASHNLEWSVEAMSDANGDSTINHSIRILGRRGVMRAQLVTGKKEYPTTLAAYRSYSSGFHFTSGEEYSAWVKGDKVAEYGLTALILGGGAAAAAKSGLFKSLIKLLIAGWKIVALAVFALFGLLKRIFSGRKRTEQTGLEGDVQISG